LSSTDDHLNRHVYNGPTVILAGARLRPSLTRRATKELDTGHVISAVQSLALTDRIVKDHHKAVPLRTVVHGSVSIPGEFSILRLSARPQRRSQDSYSRWARALGVESSLVAASNPQRSLLTVQTTAGASTVDHAAAIAGAVLTVDRLRRSLGFDPSFSTIAGPGPSAVLEELRQRALEELSQSIVNAALRHFFRHDGYWEWQSPDVATVRAYVGRPQSVSNLLAQAVVQSSERTKPARSHEVAGLAEIVGKMPCTTAVAACANIIGYSVDGRQTLAEFDGVAVGVDVSGRRLRLLLTESKVTSGSIRKCLYELNTRVDGLGVPTREIRRTRSFGFGSNRRGHGYLYLLAPYGS
jgi:hypothetical protein